ncbi:MAG: heavy metal-responsive transcriptional regulator [Candidatus Eisenbacteria bacterium]
METLTRGELAQRCAVNFETVRYYEQQGLIPKPSRSVSNYRLYDEDTVRRIRFIKRSQELGFTLHEIKELLSLRAEPRAGCADVRERAQTKVRDIDEKIRTLQAMRRALSKLTSKCTGRGGISECPILDALEDDEP